MVAKHAACPPHLRGAALALGALLSLPGVAAAAFFEPDPPPPRVPLLGEFVRPLDRRLMLVLSAIGEFNIPAGEFANHAKAHISGGGGVGAELRLAALHAARLTFSATHTKLQAKEKGLSGPVSLTPLDLRLDYIYGNSWWRPYLGVGVGTNPWHGKILQIATDLQNEGEGTPASFVAAAGLDVGIAYDISLAPEVSWTRIGGGFNASLWRAGLVLRGSI